MDDKEHSQACEDLSSVIDDDDDDLMIEDVDDATYSNRIVNRSKASRDTIRVGYHHTCGLIQDE